MHKEGPKFFDIYYQIWQEYVKQKVKPQHYIYDTAFSQKYMHKQMQTVSLHL